MRSVSAARHSPPTTSGRGSIAVKVLVGVAAALVVGLGARFLALALGADEPATGCGEGTTQLHVAAAPAIAPVVAALGREHRAALGGPGCVEVVVQPVDPHAEIQALAQGTVRPPDVWIPDSTLWLDRAVAEEVARATNARSVASSPLVLAVPKATADRLRGTSSRPTITHVAAAAAAGTFSVELSGERLSPSRVGTILALTSATAGAPDARASLTALLRSASVATSPAPERLTSLPSSGTVGVPVSEHDVWAANGAGSPTATVAIYTGDVSFDFPYAVLTHDPATVRRAQALYDALIGSTGQYAIKAAGLRDAHGVGGVVLTDARGVDGTTPVTPAVLTPAALAEAERALATATQDARLLAVIDVSGSMAWGLAGREGPGPSRLAIAAGAAGKGMALYPDSTEVGLWLFSEDLTGHRDYREIAPITRLGASAASAAGASGTGDGRSALSAALAKAAPVTDGGTALYATTLAAVRHVAAHWDPTRVNAVVLLSDGKDTDPAGPTLEALVAALSTQSRSGQPVPVITIAFGPEGDAASLAAISKASGGAAYRASTADQVRQIFLDAVGQRACRPHCT